MRSRRSCRVANVVAAFFLSLFTATASAAPWGYLPGSYNYYECFGLVPGQTNLPSTGTSPKQTLKGDFKVVVFESNAPGNVYHDAERPNFRFQVENLTDGPLKISGKVETIRYSQSSKPGDQWNPELRRLEVVGSAPIEVDLGPGGWENLSVEPPMAQTKGGYGFVVDLGMHGRQFLTSAVRTFKPTSRRIQYPKQCLEHMPPAILQRIGVQALRYAISFITEEEKSRYRQVIERLEHDLPEMHKHNVTCIAEIGAGTSFQPMDRGRPHLDEDGVMKQGKMDLCWLPATTARWAASAVSPSRQ